MFGRERFFEAGTSCEDAEDSDATTSAAHQEGD